MTRVKRVLVMLCLACAACERDRNEAQRATFDYTYAGMAPSVTAAWHGVPFDADAWKAADERGRFDMLPDLVANHLRFGMKGAELEALLGPLTQGWSDADSAVSYVYWVEQPVDASLRPPVVVPQELRQVRGVRLVLEHDRLVRWELIKP